MSDDEVRRLIRETPRPFPVIAGSDGHLDMFLKRNGLTRRDVNRVTHEHHTYGYRRETPLFVLDEWDASAWAASHRMMRDALRLWRGRGGPVVDVPDHIVEGGTREQSYMRWRLRRGDITQKQYDDFARGDQP